MKRRRLLQGAAASALVVEAGFAAELSPPTQAPRQGAPAARKTLRIAFPAPESSFDPTQTNSDLYSSTIIAQILEAPLAYDYLARPVRLVPQTAAALPEVSADGRTITVRQHWEGDGVLSDFLKAVHDRACRYFRVALSPAYNTAHHDHFHFDRGIFSRCL